MAETSRTVMIARRPFSLRSSQVERAMRGVLPEPIRDHFVVVNRRRYPPKQVVREITGLDRAEFTTHHARRILTGLGFPAGRRTADRGSRTAGGQRSHSHGSADRPGGSSRPGTRRGRRRSRPGAAALEPFVGQWVATKGAEVLVAADEPRTVVSWLAEHNQHADSMFRVPGEEREASGIAPL